MSNPLRPPLVGPPPTMTGTMIAPVCASPICTTGIPGAPVIPVVPNAYGLIGPQPTYIPHPSFPQQNFPHQVPLVNTLPRPVPGILVPASAMSRPNVDPAKLLEEQKRLEKERNFQLQQQRLKQFTVAGSKTGSLNADNLIENIIGKVQPKSSSKSNSSAKTSVLNEPMKPSKPVIETSQPFPVTVVKQEMPVNPPKPKKELEAMMRECSDLSAPQKANKFTKPSVKELAPSIQQRYTFTSSNKSRDWKNLAGLDEVFVTKRPRFPLWCNKEHIPELFKQVDALVTSNGTTPPDTKLLYPVLVSSGLPQQILGHIWELVNQSSPGQLTTEEMYAVLALIAVAQAGHIITTVDILHQLPACPIPQLQCFAAPSPPLLIEAQTISTPPPQIATNESKFAAFTDTKGPTDQNSHLVIRPSAISLKDVNNSSSVPNIFMDVKNENATTSTNVNSSGFISSPDDEFDDFKSATPTAVNFSMNTPTSDSMQGNEDFADFKQAPALSSSMIFNKIPACTNSNKPPLEEQDLMSPEEDKYSVFRTLQQTESSDDWGDFSTATTDFANTESAKQSTAKETSHISISAPPSGLLPNPSVLVTNNDTNLDLFKSSNPVSTNYTKEDDDFGEFLTAEPPVPTVEAVTSQLESLNTDFADFANFKESSSSTELHQAPPAIPASNLNINDDFGDFASSLPVPCKPELGSEFLFRHLKDNISLAESQSVSSLELGPFDGGGHSGESKSSLSRQGSIPSLDLKSAYLEGGDGEDCFGEFQSPVPISVASKSPSPAKDTKVQENGNSTTYPMNLNFQNSKNIPLTDKYSVIRAEERKDEDQHISCWVRCLQSSVNILQKTKKLFNQLSCSSVCNEVLQSEEGENYIKDVIEVYKVVRRIAAASKSAGKQTQPIVDLLNEADQIWQTICGFIAGSSLMPKESSLEFSSAVSEDSSNACGLCLLNIQMKSKLCNEETLNLSYGGRNYHSTCANLWVNCVDPLLPALPLPQLL
ncbi:synergin gamma-like [Argiope bruennichi]|uniref:synergin gamma-like n=1 Tax=Argiope bruennichi TaxID=94029 RepID=UPI0024956B08|nr:synergin gamma-like [Argiope bruennichi]XP_055925471.1 synergin gamma-like [Argiope bruennichi]